ncbi:MAG: T9SS type A sorting domain-containing protein [Bacteroidota bacterium]
MKKNIYTLSLLGILFALPIFTTAQLTNDDLANAISINSLPFTNTVLSSDAQQATAETDEEVCNNSPTSWWYEFTPTVTGNYFITSEVVGTVNGGTSNDIRLGVYTGSTHPLTRIACFNWNKGAAFGEAEGVALTAGVSYKIRVGPNVVGDILDVTTRVRNLVIWEGSVSSDWSDADNWSTASVPTAEDVVFLEGSVPNDPVVGNGTMAVAAAVRIKSQIDLTIAEGGKLSINSGENRGIFVELGAGNLVVNGELTIDNMAAGIVMQNGNFSIGANGKTSIQNTSSDGILIENSLGDITVEGELVVENSGEDGIDITTNSFNLTETGSIKISNMDDSAAAFWEDMTVDLNGELDIETAGGYGIILLNDAVLNIGSTATILMDDLGIDGIYAQNAAAQVNIDGQIILESIIGRGIRIINGTLNVNETANLRIEDAATAILLKNELTHTLNGTISISGMSVDGIALEAAGQLDIGTSAMIDIDTINFDPIYLDDASAIININGTLNLAEAENGIHVEDGIMNVGETGTVTITNTDTGIELEEDNTSTIDGQVTISDVENDGIALRDEVMLNIGENAVVDISFIGVDGIFMTPPSPVLNIDGNVRIEEIDEDGIDMVGGTINIGSTGTLHVSKIGDNGIEDIIGSNEGQITVTNVVDDAFNTGNGTFTNESTGTIDLSNAGKDCIDVGETIVNNGIVIANNCDNFTIVDGTFNNNANATLRADGLINSNNTVFAANSILEPGTSPGCIVFFSGEDFSNSTIRIEIEGTAPCAEYDQIELADTYTLTGATLELSGSYTPQIGEQFTILLNDETTDPITGTFSGLAEGATVVLNNIELSITYMGGTGGNDVVLTADAIVPVELLSFDGKVAREVIELNWQTASELNNEGFEIQRSENGKQFKTLAFVAGNGTTLETQNYTWLDEQPLSGTNYYRLKQLDFDGQYEYSSIVAIDFEQQKKVAFQIFPNPTNGILNITSIDNQAIENIGVFDVNGRLVLTIDNASPQVDLSTLPNGIYALQIRAGMTLHQTYLVKE